jgi:transposase
MTPAAPAAPQGTPLGVGFDTARYGHHVTFLRPDLQPACPAFEFPESRPGYDRVRDQFRLLHERCPDAHFHIRLDAAGQYATNLETFLRALPFPKTLSVGEPARNANYRKALFPKRKADPVESLCAARFALVEKPKATEATPAARYQLREVVQRLEGQTRQSTRLTNQLHNLLARVFPELALAAADLQAGWVLELLDRYPTPAQVARARRASLLAIPFLTPTHAEQVQTHAAATVASFTGETAGTLVRQLVTQLRHSQAAEERLHDLMAAAYRQLPQPNHLDSIPGIGIATAAVLTAKAVAIERFATPAQLVSYFGAFPQDDSSGVAKDGRPKGGRQAHMSRKGNDLARKYLWNAARTAIIHNPAVRPLFRRLRARGTRGDVALGHCMRKLLHLAFAVWKTGQPFDPEHYDWESAGTWPAGEEENAAGHKPGSGPERSVVTAADPTIAAGTAGGQPDGEPFPPPPTPAPAGGIDFAALKARVSMEQVLSHLGWLTKLRGAGAQRRGPCPIHARGDERNRSFSVHLGRQIFRCFHPPCGAHGNVLDLWAAVQGLPLYEAARHLAATVHVDL